MNSYDHFIYESLRGPRNALQFESRGEFGSRPGSRLRPAAASFCEGGPSLRWVLRAAATAAAPAAHGALRPLLRSDAVLPPSIERRHSLGHKRSFKRRRRRRQCRRHRQSSAAAAAVAVARLQLPTLVVVSQTLTMSSEPGEQAPVRREDTRRKSLGPSAVWPSFRH